MASFLSTCTCNPTTTSARSGFRIKFLVQTKSADEDVKLRELQLEFETLLLAIIHSSSQDDPGMRTKRFLTACKILNQDA